MKTRQTSGPEASFRRPANGPQASKCQTLLLNGLLLLALALLVALFGWTFLVPLIRDHGPERPNECELMDELALLHFINQQEQIRVPSQDFKTLVKFVGSVRFVSDDTVAPGIRSRQLPLALKSVRMEEDRLQRRLVLMTSCGRLTLRLASDARQLLVANLELETIRVGRTWPRCQVGSTDIRLNDAATRRYVACRQRARDGADDQPTSRMKLPCHEALPGTSVNTYVLRQVAELHIHSLEFELGGRPELIRQGIFSRPAQSCGDSAGR